MFFGFYIKSRVLDGDCTPLPRPPVLQKRGPDYTNTDVEASDCGEHRRAAAAVAISEPLLELIVVSTVGALCFGCGYFAAFIVTYAKFRNEMVKRGRSL